MKPPYLEYLEVSIISYQEVDLLWHSKGYDQQLSECICAWSSRSILRCCSSMLCVASLLVSCLLVFPRKCGFESRYVYWCVHSRLSQLSLFDRYFSRLRYVPNFLYTSLFDTLSFQIILPILWKRNISKASIFASSTSVTF